MISSNVDSPRLDVRVRHPHDRREAVVDAPARCRWAARPSSPAVSRECSRPTRTPSRIRSVFVAGTPSSSYLKLPRRSGTAAPSTMFRCVLTELPAQHHDLLHAVVLVHEVRLGEVPERLVAEHAGQDRVQHDGVDVPAFDVGRVQQLDGAVGRSCSPPRPASRCTRSR